MDRRHRHRLRPAEWHRRRHPRPLAGRHRRRRLRPLAVHPRRLPRPAVRRRQRHRRPAIRSPEVQGVAVVLRPAGSAAPPRCSCCCSPYRRGSRYWAARAVGPGWMCRCDRPRSARDPPRARRCHGRTLARRSTVLACASVARWALGTPLRPGAPPPDWARAPRPPRPRLHRPYRPRHHHRRPLLLARHRRRRRHRPHRPPVRHHLLDGHLPLLDQRLRPHRCPASEARSRARRGRRAASGPPRS
ncbi:hypothetical protein NQZ70_09530 [Sorangium sp. Soce836]|nr:hypothetical protein NQZ70_09530 [Sorangium sp. Soce836]